MAVRRRAVETVRAEDAASPVGSEGTITVTDGHHAEEKTVRNALVEEGHRLYAEAEKSGFHDEASLTRSLQHFLRAALLGVEEAADWISSFLDSMSALPPTAALPPSLLRLLRWVQHTTPEEREVYLVAEEMFRTMARGITTTIGITATIPKTEFDAAVQKLLSSRFEHSPQLIKSAKELRNSVKKMLLTSLESNSSTEVTMEMFCESAVTYARGELPQHEDGELTLQQQRDFKDANILKKAVNFPMQTAHFYKRSVLKMIERRGVKWLWASFPTKQFYLLLLAYVLPMISAHFILSSIATVVFAGALIAMSVGTLQVILQAEKVFSFMEYSSIFQYFSEGDRRIDTRRPEALLIKRSAPPYLTFVISYCIALLTFHLAHQSIIPSEVVCMLSALFTLAVFFQFECYKSALFVVSSSSRLLSWLYVFLLVFRKVIPIPEFLFYIGSTVVSIPVFPGLTLRLNALTMIQLPLQLAVTAYFLYHNKWHNFYSGLGPYLLFVSWWVLSRYFFALSSPFYLFLTTFGILIVMAISPFLPVLFLGSPIFFLIYYGVSKQFFTSLSLVVIFIVVFLLVGTFFRRLMEAKWLNISFDYLFLLQIVISIPAIFVGATWFARLYSPTEVPVVSVAQYSEYCGPQNWVGGNMVQTQLNCLHLRDRMVTSSGLVKAVRIEEITNDQELTLKSLPASLRMALTCLLGRLEPMCGHDSDMETCRREYTGCHFHHSNKYTFSVDLAVRLPPPSSPAEESEVSVTLLASSSFAEPVKRLEAGTRLQFNASFVSGMGSDKLLLRLVALEGHMEGRDEEVAQDNVQLLLDQFINSITNTFAILFDVLFGYTAI